MIKRNGKGLLGGLRDQPPVKKYSAREFPVQSEIQNLEAELSAFNERLAELEDQGHRGHAIEVLKVNAMDFARRIDELRCMLVEPTAKDVPKGRPCKS
jgi:hypothetical protein